MPGYLQKICKNLQKLGAGSIAFFIYGDSWRFMAIHGDSWRSQKHSGNELSKSLRSLPGVSKKLIKLYFYQQLTHKNGNILYLIQDYHESGLFLIPTTSYIICGDVTEAELTNDHDRQSQTLAYIH